MRLLLLTEKMAGFQLLKKKNLICTDTLFGDGIDFYIVFMEHLAG
jgi:hypothetical protein